VKICELRQVFEIWIKIRSLLVYIDDIIMIDNLGLNLYVVSATCCVVVILENQGLARIRKFLVGV